jgi:hypothetical protein
MPDVSAVLQSLPGVLQIVNVVVLLSALFFFTSTISSHLLEVFVGVINSRGKQLRARLEFALGPDAAKAIYDDPIIRSLSSGSPSHSQPPSYIEPDMFARVVARLSTVDNAMSSSGVIKVIKGALARPEDIEPKLIEWFRAINDRQTGVYTRWTFLRLLIVGFLMAGVMDIDTVHIAGKLWSNPEQAEKAAKALEGAKRTTEKSEPLSDSDQKRLQESVAAAYAQLRSIAPPSYAWQAPPENVKEWLAKVFGWLLTALATSLGAQFWFNIMSEALKLRAAGRKPDDDPKTKEEKQKKAGGGGG